MLRILQAIGYVAFTTPAPRWSYRWSRRRSARRLAVFGAAANLAIALTPAAVAALLEVAPLEAGPGRRRRVRGRRWAARRTLPAATTPFSKRVGARRVRNPAGNRAAADRVGDTALPVAADVGRQLAMVELAAAGRSSGRLPRWRARGWPPGCGT